MKIAFFNYLPLEYGGGLATYFMTVAHGLKKRYGDLQIDIITFDRSLGEKFSFIYSLYYIKKVYRKPLLTRKETASRFKGIGYRQYATLGLLKQALKQYDILYSKNDILEACILRLIYEKKHFPKIIFGFHTPVHYPSITSPQALFHNLLYDSPLYRWAINKAALFHTINRFDTDYLGKKFPGKKVVRIACPIEVKKSGNEARKQAGNKNKINILWIGRLTEQKGVKDLVEIIDTLNDDVKYRENIRWHIAGDGELKDLITEMENRFTNISYYGYLGQEAMANLYAKGDLLISTSHWEVFPYNLLEAQSAGIPVIAYDIPGPVDIIENGKTGFLVEDIRKFKQKIMDFADRKTKLFSRFEIEKKFIIAYNNDRIYHNIFQMMMND